MTIKLLTLITEAYNNILPTKFIDSFTSISYCEGSRTEEDAQD